MCPTCSSSETILEVVSFANTDLSDAQKKRTRESSTSTEKSSSKKMEKTGGKKVSSMLKELIEELLTDVPKDGSETEIFRQIRNAESGIQNIFESRNSEMPKLSRNAEILIGRHYGNFSRNY